MALQLEEYIAYRKSLGYTDKSLRSLLRSFDRYLIEKSANQTSLEPRFFLELREELKGEPRTVNGILSAIRGFFQYLIRKGIYEENPLLDIPLCTENAYIPFVFSPDQIEQLLLSIQKKIRKDRKHFFKDLPAYVAIVLMARCGMRISEPLRLRIEHYRSREGTLYIEKTKFSKDRLIPVPKPAINEINNYLAVRNTFIKDQNPYLLAGQNGKRLTNNKIYPVFHQAVKDIGIDYSQYYFWGSYLSQFKAFFCHKYLETNQRSGEIASVCLADPLGLHGTSQVSIYSRISQGIRCKTPSGAGRFCHINAG